MNKTTALSGVLASASAGANGTTDTTVSNGSNPSTPDGSVKSVLSRILVPASSMAAVGTKKEIGTIEIRRSPDRDAWVTVRSGAEWTVASVALIDADTNDGGQSLYVVDGSLLSDTRVQREVKLYALRLAQTSDGELFVWALRKGEDNWAASSRAAAELATKSWVRVVSNRVNGRYDIFSPEAALNIDLAWPEMSFDEILTVALRDRMIDAFDHSVLKKLRGAF